jgi:small nuclear ribonucleoprotein (snRNP)-like protein
MITETLKEYINEFVSVKTENSPNLLVGTLVKVDTDHILLKGERGSEVVISTRHIINVVRK